MSTKPKMTPNSDGTFTVTKEFIGNLIETAVKVSAEKTGNHIYAKICEERSKNVDEFDKRLYNVKLLLENYLTLKEHVKNAVFDLQDYDEEITAIEILDSMGSGRRSELAIESIKRSAIRTNIIMNHVDEMMNIYETVTCKSVKEEDQRRFDVIKRLYLMPLPYGVRRTEMQNELSEYWHVDVRQIRRDINDALERITALIFGIDGVYLLNKRKARQKKQTNNQP